MNYPQLVWNEYRNDNTSKTQERADRIRRHWIAVGCRDRFSNKYLIRCFGKCQN